MEIISEFHLSVIPEEVTGLPPPTFSLFRPCDS